MKATVSTVVPPPPPSIESYRHEMVVAVDECLSEIAAQQRLTKCKSGWDAIPVAQQIVAFLPLPAAVCQAHLCKLVQHTNLEECEQYGRQLLEVGIRMGTLGHLVRMEGGSSFWQQMAPGKVWRHHFQLQGGGHYCCETVWEDTPIIHAGNHLVITTTSKDNDNGNTIGGLPTTLVSVVLYEPLQVGHFIWLREWLNQFFNKNQSHHQKEEATMQAMLEVVQYTAEQVHLQVVCHPTNFGDYEGFWIKPTSTLKYDKGWNFFATTTTAGANGNGLELEEEIEWLRQVWEMYVKPISPWNKNKNKNKKDNEKNMDNDGQSTQVGENKEEKKKKKEKQQFHRFWQINSKIFRTASL